MRSFTIFSVLFSLMLLASVASSSQDMFADIMRRVSDIKLADDSSTATSVTATDTASDSTTATDASATDSNTASGTASGTDTTTGTNTQTTSGTGTNTATGTNTDKTTGTNTKTTGGSKTTSSTKSTSISIDPEWPEGGASMTNPASTTTTYYKIGNNVTFGWNFTSVEVTPTAIDVIASCSSNAATYTLANNVSYANATSVVWNTDQYGSNAQSPLLTAHYTLIIYEAGTSPTDVGSAGYLGPASYTFGMYIPQPYTSLADYVCVTCSAAVSDMERQALGFMLTMVTITVFSFTAFAGGFGLFN